MEAGVGLKENALCEDGADVVVEAVDLTKLNPLVAVLDALVAVLNTDEDGAAMEALVSVWEYLFSISCRCFL